MSTFNPAYPVLERESADVTPTYALWRSPLPKDERLNQITHGVGFLLSLIAAILLLSVTPWLDGVRATGGIIYAFAMTALYLSSTLSHSFVDHERRTFWRAADQVAILGMSVGSFVPFAVVHVNSPFGWTLLALSSTCAAILSVIRILRWERGVPVFAMLCVSLLPALALHEMIRVGGVVGTALLVAGTLSYLIGLWFLMNDHRRVYYHAIWHISTIMGSAFHFVFVYFWCIVDGLPVQVTALQF